MAKTSPVPRFVLAANMLTKTLLRAGVNLRGMGHPTYLLTVRGRKSGLPRTTPISVIVQDGRRYVMTPYGAVDWVRNLRAAGEATLTRGRKQEIVLGIELPVEQAAPVLKKFIDTRNPIGRFFNIAPGSPLEKFEVAVTSHPVFLLQPKTGAGTSVASRASQNR